jgi:hypothetical protein
VFLSIGEGILNEKNCVFLATRDSLVL